MNRRSLRSTLFLWLGFGGLAALGALCASTGRLSGEAPPASTARGEAHDLAPPAASPSVSSSPSPSPSPSPSRGEPRLWLGAAARSACDINTAGEVRCWGNNDRGQLGGDDHSKPWMKPLPVPNLPPAEQAALGAGHTCALLRDGAVRCWGEDAAIFGALDALGRIDVKGLGHVIEIVSGAAYSCSLNAAREVFCWGRVPGANEDAPASTPRRIHDLEATRIAAASAAVCALRTTGTVACFGENKGSSIVPQGPSRVERPTDVEKLADAIDIAMSDDATCAVTRGGSASCWGEKRFSAYGPWSVYAVEDAVAITGGAAGHFCAIASSGKVRCWGDSSTGATGGGRYGWSNEIDGSFTEVRAGLDFTCARASSGAVRCWGTNTVGQLAQDFEDAVVRPTRLRSVDGARKIAASRDATCVVLSDFSLRCFGPDPTEDSPEDAGPHDFESIMRADDIVMSRGLDPSLGAPPRANFVACAFTDRLPTCWGNNRASHLPTQDAVVITRPSTLASMRDAKAYALGSEHACSLSDDGSVRCWGGLGKTRALPTRVKNVADAAVIALGSDEGCALIGDGTVACWPLRDAPQDSSERRRRFAAERVLGVRGMTAIALGRRHACAVDARGGVMCWGSGERGALGRDARSDAAPERVAGIEDAVDLALGDDFSCARRRDGSASCWGRNDHGQLGDGAREDRAAPAPVVDLKDVTSIKAGAAHACALTKKGEVLCWGDNRLRVIEQGSPLLSRSPMTVTVRSSPTEAPVAPGEPITL